MAAAAACLGQAVVEAEQASAGLAQTAGQWTAFRQAAAEDAIMFAPGPPSATPNSSIYVAMAVGSVRPKTGSA